MYHHSGDMHKTLETRARHASNSYKCITRLIVTGTGHYYAAWVWSCTNFVHIAQDAPLALPPNPPSPSSHSLGEVHRRKTPQVLAI